MPRVRINPYRHGLTKEQAFEHLEQHRPQLISQYGDQALNFDATWRGSVLHFSFDTTDRREVTGSLTVEDEFLYLDVHVDPLNFIERALASGRVQNSLFSWLDKIFNL